MGDTVGFAGLHQPACGASQALMCTTLQGQLLEPASTATPQSATPLPVNAGPTNDCDTKIHTACFLVRIPTLITCMLALHTST